MANIHFNGGGGEKGVGYKSDIKVKLFHSLS